MISIDKYFRIFQQDLLQLANTEGGRFLLGIKDKAPIIKIVPFAFHQLVDFKKDIPIIVANFYWEEKCRVIAEALVKMQTAQGAFILPHTMIGKPVRIINPYEAFLHYTMLQNSRKNYPLIMLATFDSTTFLGGAGKVLDDNATFATMHDGATGDTATAGTYYVEMTKQAAGGTQYRGQRAYLPINTSSIGVGATVTEENIKFNARRAVSAPSENIYIGFTETAQATLGSLATSEWGNKGAGVNLQGAGWEIITDNTDAAHDMSISDFSATNVSGNSKFGFRERFYDMGNTAPGATDDVRAILSAPNLVVVYTPAPSGNQEHQITPASIQQLKFYRKSVNSY